MIKIFQYELRRLLLNKYTAGLLLVIGFYSYLVMEGETIRGISNTAPFSPWSFGVYLAKILPLLLASLLFFVSFLYSRQAERVNVLTDAARIRQSCYRMARYGAIATAFLLVALVPVAYAFWLYGATFHFSAFHTLMPPLFFVLLPPFFLVMGLGCFAGRFHPAAIYGLIPVVLLLGLLPFPGYMDPYGAGFLSAYPASLSGYDPVFRLPDEAVHFKLLLALAGIGFTAEAVFTGGNRRR